VIVPDSVAECVADGVGVADSVAVWEKESVSDSVFELVADWVAEGVVDSVKESVSVADCVAE